MLSTSLKHTFLNKRSRLTAKAQQVGDVCLQGLYVLDENNENCVEVVIDECANTPDVPECIAETDLGDDTLPVDENTETWSEDAVLEQAPVENTEAVQ